MPERPSLVGYDVSLWTPRSSGHGVLRRAPDDGNTCKGAVAVTYLRQLGVREPRGWSGCGRDRTRTRRSARNRVAPMVASPVFGQGIDRRRRGSSAETSSGRFAGLFPGSTGLGDDPPGHLIYFVAPSAPGVRAARNSDR